MKKSRTDIKKQLWLLTLVTVILLAGCNVTTPVTQSPSASPPTQTSATPTLAANATSGLNKIQHFVFIMQENRSFDSYFGTYPGANGLPPGISFADPRDGKTVAPYHDTNDINLGGPHGWDNALNAIDNGKMDGFLKEAYKGLSANGTALDPNITPGHNPKDVISLADATNMDFVSFFWTRNFLSYLDYDNTAHNLTTAEYNRLINQASMANLKIDKISLLGQYTQDLLRKRNGAK